MKDAILIELAERWERETHNGLLNAEREVGPAGDVQAAKDTGRRETLRECADTLRTLIGMLGNEADFTR